MLYFVIFWITFIVTLLIIMILKQGQKSAVINAQTDLNANVWQKLKERNISITKTLYLIDNNTIDKSNAERKQILIDGVNKDIYLIDYEAERIVTVRFDEILSYEVYENGSTITRAVGSVGFALGGLLAEHSGNCKDLRIIFKLNGMETSMVAYDIVTNGIGFAVNKSSTKYSACIKSLQQVTAFFDIIIENNKKEEKVID